MECNIKMNLQELEGGWAWIELVWFRIGRGGQLLYVGYSGSKNRLRISLAHPRDCHFAHVQ